MLIYQYGIHSISMDLLTFCPFFKGGTCRFRLQPRQVSSWENPLVPFLRRIVELGAWAAAHHILQRGLAAHGTTKSNTSLGYELPGLVNIQKANWKP